MSKDHQPSLVLIEDLKDGVTLSRFLEAVDMFDEELDKLTENGRVCDVPNPNNISVMIH